VEGAQTKRDGNRSHAKDTGVNPSQSQGVCLHLGGEKKRGGKGERVRRVLGRKRKDEPSVTSRIKTRKGRSSLTEM